LEPRLLRNRFFAMRSIAQSAATTVLILTMMTAASAQPSVPGNNRGCSQPGNSENLSDKLAQSGGVLCPQNVDPAIKAPTPPTGDKPAIRPPGSGGGNPKVAPK
jgi:hypothetical protein